MQAEKNRNELCRFLGYLKFPHQPYKKLSLDILESEYKVVEPEAER